jgi:hypothetical protein
VIVVGRRSYLSQMGKWTAALMAGRLLSKSETIIPSHFQIIACQFQKQKKNKDNLILMWSMLLGSSVFVNIILIVAICLAFFFIYHKKLKRPIINVNAVEMNLRCFTYKELVEATDGFKEELGKGAFGVVYKGSIQMSSNVLVAVKKLNKFVSR